jgi:glutathione S-transferase
MIQLHYAPGTAGMAPHIVLEEIGVPFEKILVDTAAGANLSDAYRRLNPNGTVPVLIDGDVVLYESAAICLHLCDAHPEAALAPVVATAERAHFYKWLVWLTNTLQPSLMMYIYPERWMNEGNQAGVAELKANAERKVGLLLDQLDTELAQLEKINASPWLLGAQYTAVDAYTLMLGRWSRHFSLSKRASDYPHLGPYLQRVLARPAVVKVFEAEGLGQPWV